MANNNLEKFWRIYDEYASTGDKKLHPELSSLLKEIENKDKRTHLLRPEKGWNEILAWRVLRDQEFIFSNSDIFHLYEGEIMAWTPHWDRDVFLTRVPYKEIVSGRYLKPGFKMSIEDRNEDNEWQWSQQILKLGLTDERGLYLPIYDAVTLMKFVDQEIAKIRPKVLWYFQSEKGFEPEVVKNL